LNLVQPEVQVGKEKWGSSDLMAMSMSTWILLTDSIYNSFRTDCHSMQTPSRCVWIGHKTTYR
jgi:hypothetical protein